MSQGIRDSLAEISELLASDKPRTRLNGYGHLKALLENKDVHPYMKKDVLTDFIVLIMKSIEKDLHVWNPAVADSNLDERLAMFADQLRKLVDQFKMSFRRQHIELLLEHLIGCLRIHRKSYTLQQEGLQQDTLEVDDDSYICTPVLAYYAKSISIICMLPFHLDHLSHKIWRRCVLRICKSLELLISSGARSDTAMFDLWSSLQLLINHRPQSISDTTVRTPTVITIENFLSTYHVGTNCHALVYSCLSTIITRHSLKDINDAGAFIALGYQHLGKHLESKSEPLKEQIYLFINITYDLLAYLLPRVSIEDEDVSTGTEFLRHFLDTLRVLIKSENVNILSVEDLLFETSVPSGFLQLQLFRLNPAKNKLAWLYISSCAKVAMLASSIRCRLQLDDNGNISGSESNNNLTIGSQHQPSRNSAGWKLPTCQDFVDMWTFYKLPFNVLFYEIFSFVIQELPVMYPLDLIKEKLLPAMSVNNNLLTTWAIICAGCILKRTPSSYSIDPKSGALTFLWQQFKLSLISDTASVASCFAVNMLLESQVLPPDSQTIRLEEFIAVWDVHVPILSSSSLKLCKHLLRFETTSSKITRYLSSNLLDWFISHMTSHVVSNKSYTTYLTMHFSIDMYQCMCLFSGLPIHFKSSSQTNYTGTCGLEYNRHKIFYELWVYLRLRDGVQPITAADDNYNDSNSQNSLAVSAATVAQNEKHVIAAIVSCLPVIQLRTDSKNWGGALSFLVTCSLYLSTLQESKPSGDSLKQLTTLYEDVVESLNVTEVSQYDEMNIQLLFETIAALNQAQAVGTAQHLSSALISIMKKSLSPIDEDVNFVGYEQFVSSTRFYQDNDDFLLLVNLHQWDKMVSAAKFQRRSWVIQNQISKMRLEYSGTSLELLLGLCDVMKRDDEFLVWCTLMFPYLPDDFKTLDDKNIFEYQVVYQKLLRKLSQRILSSYSWNYSDIGLELILKTISLGFLFQSIAEKHHNGSTAFLSKADGIESDMETLLDRVFEQLRERGFRFLTDSTKLILTTLCCNVLRIDKNKTLKSFEKYFECSCYELLMSLFGSKDCLSLFHSMDSVADFLVDIHDLQFQYHLYKDFSDTFRSTTASVDLPVMQTNFIWKLAVRGFPISWLSCHIVELASIKEVEPHVEIQLAKLRKFFHQSGNYDLFKKVTVPIIDYWFEIATSLEGFPFRLCGYESERHFFCENYISVVSNFLLRNDKSESTRFLHEVSKLLDLSYVSLLEAVYPRAFALLISVQAENIKHSYVGLTQFIEKQQVIPAPASGVDLNNIIREIIFITDLSKVSSSLMNREPFLSIFRDTPLTASIPKLGTFSLDDRTSEWLLESLWKYYADTIDRSISFTDFNGYICQKSLFNALIIDLLALNPQFTDNGTKFVRIRQVMFLYHFSGPNILPESDLSAALVDCKMLDITLRGLLPYVNDPDLCCEVCPFIVWLLRTNMKWLLGKMDGQNIKLITNVLSDIKVGSVSRAPVKNLLDTVKNFVIPRFFADSKSYDAKVRNLLTLLVDGLLGHDVSLTSEDILFILNSSVLEVDHFLAPIMMEISKNPDLMLEKGGTNWSLDNARLFLQKMDSSLSRKAAEPNPHFKSWLCRLMGQTYLEFGQLGLPSKECPTENVSNSVMVAVVQLMIEYVNMGDPQIINAAHKGLMELLHSQSTKDSFYDDDSEGSVVDDSLTVFDSLPLSLQPLFEGRFRITVPLPEKNIHPLPELPYDQWIKQICIRFLPYLQPLVPSISGLQYLIDFSADFAERLLLILMQKRYDQDRDSEDDANEYKALLGMFLSYFLQDSSIECVDLDRKRQLVLQIICVLRVDGDIPISDEISLTHAAKFALEIGMSKTALMLLEVNRLDNVSNNDSMGVDDEAREADLQRGKDLLIRISEKIGRDDPDMKYATLNVPTLNQAISAIRGVENKNEWNRLSYESALLDSTYIWDKDSSSSKSLFNLARAFGDIGMYGMTELVDDSMASSSSSLEDSEKYSYQWKIRKWDLPVNNTSSPGSLVYKMFKSLATANDVDTRDCGSLFDKIYEDSYKSKDRFIRELGIIRECEEIWRLNVLPEEHIRSTVQLFLKQRERTEPWMLSKDYSDIEELIAAREISWNLRSRAAPEGSLKSIVDLCMSLSSVDNAKYSWKFNRSHKAVVHTLQLQNLAESCFEDMPGIRDVVARTSDKNLATVMWHMGNQSHSISKLRSVAIPLPSVDEIDKRPDYWWQFFSDIEMVCDLVRWSSVARHEPFEYIQQEYLAPVRAFTDDLEVYIENNVKNEFVRENLQQMLDTGRADVYHTYAVFCHEQYTSSDLISEEEILETQKKDKQREIEEAREMLTGSEARAHLAKLKAMLAYDQSRLRDVKRARADLLNLSIENYLLSISTSDKYLEDTSRFFALWMENLDIADVNKRISMAIDDLPTAKLVPWINQLVSLLTLDAPEGDQNTRNQLRRTNVERLVINVCLKHPYHCLYEVLALAKTPSTSSHNDLKMSIRKSVGTKLWGMVEKGSSYKLKQIMKKMDKFVSETENLVVSVASFMDSSRATELPNKRRRLGVKGLTSPSIKLRSLSNGRWWVATEGLQSLKIPLPTLNIPVRADADYSDLPVMCAASEKLRLANGLSRPIIMAVQSSDGKTTKMVIKSGDDDLRQDAIMEQVFDHVNVLLSRNDTTRARDLKMKTYKVVPLNPRLGVIEFVDNAVALLDILETLHEKYRPTDMPIETARNRMKVGLSHELKERVESYLHIEKTLKPVLGMFFLERFFSPDDWFKNQLRYTRSVAAGSILGYVIGLGDRHCRNILLDSTTGELVHIDLGIAFDQGKLLPVPETVPFRLTRDIVDGMGIMGTAGSFERCCELTLDVLRSEISSVMTILNVLKYDPLYSWTLSPMRKMRLQLSENKDVNKVRRSNPVSKVSQADRALAMVRGKLSKNLSSEAVTRQLIQQAQSSKNLSLIYYGWCPFL